MRMNRSNLDEQQEQTLLKIESKTCWFSYWALLITIVGQMTMYGMQDTMKYIAGEWIIFMCMCIYLCYACLKNGIWDRKLKAGTGSNVFISLVAAMITGVVAFLIKVKEYSDSMGGCVATGIFMAGLVFAFVFICLEIAMISYKKKVCELEKEPDEDESAGNKNSRLL